MDYSELMQISPAKLMFAQRAGGRSVLTNDDFQYWQKVHTFCQELLAQKRLKGNRLKSIEFIELATRSLSELYQLNRVPRYYCYTDVHFLDWFVGGERKGFTEYKQKLIEGIYHLAHNFLHFESDSIARIGRYAQDKVVLSNVHTRIEKLKNVFDHVEALNILVIEKPFALNCSPIMYNTFEEFASEKSRVSGLVYFSCFPQTNFHDEVTFLRTIHIAEFCFIGIRLCLMEAIGLMEISSFTSANNNIIQAIEFSKILHEIFKVLKTMPPEHFADFRDATGNASAIQSKNYQEMDIYCRGLDTNRATPYKENSHLTYLHNYGHQDFLSLKKAIKMFYKDTNEWKILIESVKILDRQLLTWRGFHLALAKGYLPKEAMGTGNTSGVSYLEMFFRSSILDDTQIDYEAFCKLFSKEECPDIHEFFLRVPTSIGICPTYLNNQNNQSKS